MHHLELFTDGTAAFASRLDAWHRLGTITGECMTGEQVMDKAKLGGWNVRKLPLTATEITTDGVTTLEVPDKYATVRTHPVTGATDYLGTVGNDYTVRQNEEQVELLDALVEASGANTSRPPAASPPRGTANVRHHADTADYTESVPTITIS